MSPRMELSTPDYWTIFFGFLTVVFGGVTAWAFVRDQEPIQILLLGMLTVYAFSITLSTFQQRGAQFKRLAAIPLGAVGVFAYSVGAPTDLPIFFILLGIGSLVDLVWDPTGNVYKDHTE